MKSWSITSLLFIIVLGGCTQYWGKPGGTASEFEADKAECNALAYGQFPPNVITNTTYTGGYQAPSQTNCTVIGNTMNCTSQPSPLNVPSIPVTTSQDINVQARNAAWESCMYGKGYQKTANQSGASLTSEEVNDAIESCTIDSDCKDDLLCRYDGTSKRCVMPVLGKKNQRKAGASCTQHDDCSFDGDLMCFGNVCKTIR